MGNFSDYADTDELIDEWTGQPIDRIATQEELDHLFGVNRKSRLQADHYANNEDFGQF